MQDQFTRGLRSEHLFLDRLASEKLDPRTYARWAAVRSSHRFMAHKNKRIIAFRLAGNIPVVLNVFECDSINASFEQGISTHWHVRNRPEEGFTVGHCPVEIADGCFMGHTTDTSTDYVEYDKGKRGMLVSMFYKTPANPITSLYQGPAYLLEEPAFHRLFPE
jgi:hypothetical protein